MCYSVIKMINQEVEISDINMREKKVELAIGKGCL